MIIILLTEVFLLILVCIALFNINLTRFLRKHPAISAILNATHLLILDKIVGTYFPGLGQIGAFIVSLAIITLSLGLIFRGRKQKKNRTHS